MLRIGVLIPLGWKEGRNLEVSFRWATNEAASARELVALRRDAILTRATPATAAVMRETSTIPIVFVNVSDPIGARCFLHAVYAPPEDATVLAVLSTTGKPISHGVPSQFGQARIFAVMRCGRFKKRRPYGSTEPDASRTHGFGSAAELGIQLRSCLRSERSSRFLSRR
jgi:hypothetical protein